MTKVHLDAEIEAARRSIATDGYPMSIGEITNLYRDQELIIRPEYQRFFRWTLGQKSRLIESILLGIPIPSIFVAQTEGGIWEVVDGLQRLSTIFELQGELRLAHGTKAPPLRLEGTKYLPHLEGKYWDSKDENQSLTNAQRLDLKRSKIDVKIIKRESSSATKFDLFQRLNSYGSQLNNTEMRSALMVAASPDFFSEIEALSSSEDFRFCVPISEKQVEERFDIELTTRFIVLHDWPEEKLKQSELRDLPTLLDDHATEMATKFPQGFATVKNTFQKTFSTIAQNGDEDVFRRFDVKRGEFRGPFLTSAFEIIGLGLGYHVARGAKYRTDIVDAAKQLWSSPQMQAGYSTGRSTESRLAEFIPMGRELMKA